MICSIYLHVYGRSIPLFIWYYDLLDLFESMTIHINMHTTHTYGERMKEIDREHSLV